MSAMVVESALREALARDGAVQASAVSPATRERLASAGLSLQNEGDRLVTCGPPVDWLRSSSLAAALTANNPPADDALRVRDVHLAFTVDSTNARALQTEWPPEGQCDLWLADHQSAGRGRRDARWDSPFGSGLCLTLATALAWRHDLAALPLVLGLAARRALRELGASEVAVKWPNDLLVAGRKLGGILVQSRHMSGRAPGFAMGLGLNVHAVPKRVAAGALSPVCLRDIFGDEVPSRHHVAVSIVRHWQSSLTRFVSAGFGAFAAEWSQADCLFGRPVDVGDERVMTGTARGVDDTGQLRLATAQGMHTVPCGAIRIRPHE